MNAILAFLIFLFIRLLFPFGLLLLIGTLLEKRQLLHR